MLTLRLYTLRRSALVLLLLLFGSLSFLATGCKPDDCESTLFAECEYDPCEEYPEECEGEAAPEEDTEAE